ncbi:DUF1206 domain-containing protein [Microvirga arsenatis]|uniref:DUF1206 domain-containing protein n=1 Tax=Microvirga arsenatis TaxID=2692265 RepID=A0ABW9Z023_9HYPH|nr:DUF1206 domain-containing protein [Microvirga arsenatis]NBJ10423.1 DUF1206 domain-containing protein [Microvirga arsenatis]NBJ24678.1 DUF1206 domain-containing protein [Microvirga arsenatis]
MPHISRRPVETMARFGYGARGVVYGLVGGLALLAAIGSGGQTGGSRNALQTLLTQPFGKVWLVLIALGLFGFCAWRILEALTDADNRGSDMKGWAIRGAHLVSGFIYAGLALFALNLALGRSSGGGGEDQAARDWTAWLMSQPFGQWLVGLVGLAVAGTGLAFIVKAWRGRVADRLSLPAEKRHWICTIGRMGFAARGVVFLMIGGFVGLAALHASSSEVRGLGGAMEALQRQPYGWVLLALTALGLFAFGLFGLIQARYRRIDAPDLDDAKAAVAQMGR